MQVFSYSQDAVNLNNPINALSGHDAVSEKYQHGNSLDLIAKIESQGFTLIDTSYAKVRNKNKSGFQKHVMIFEHETQGFIDDHNRVRLLVTNSHDRSSSLVFNVGVYRTVCSNGLVVGDTYFERRIKHIGTDFNVLVETGLEDMLERFRIVADKVKVMQSIRLSDNQVKELTYRVALKRLEKVEGLQTFNVDYATPQREEDKGNTLYNVFNRAQEVALKGGLAYRTMKVDEDNVIAFKNGTTRAVKEIDASKKLNKFIWEIAESYMKSAA